MSEREQYYDDVIAPKLRAIAQDAHDHGMNFSAFVEYDAGEVAETSFHQDMQSLSMLMARWSVAARGNVDVFWMQVQKYARKYGHTSMFLHAQEIPEKPE